MLNRSRHEAEGWEPPVWAQLIVSPKRAREIHEKLWPEDEMRGRPIILYKPQRNETLKQRIPKRAEEAVEEEEPELAVPTWRKTFSFDGREDLLMDDDGDSVEAVAA